MEHICTVCGKRGKWSDTWSWYGSVLLMDALPQDIPKACSAECADEMRTKITLKEWRVPDVKPHGVNGYVIVSGRMGY